MSSIDFVVPVYNEEDGLLAFHQLLDQTELPEDFARRYIYVNDGSTDNTAALLDRLAAADSRVKVIHLTRNFGHQAALTAGLDAVTGDVVVSMDGDGQHPPSLVPVWIGLLLGGLFVLLAAMELAYTSYIWLGGHREQLVPGWASLVLILTIASALMMLLQGILGIYVGMIFKEVKRRPIYLVKK